VFDGVVFVLFGEDALKVYEKAAEEIFKNANAKHSGS